MGFVWNVLLSFDNEELWEDDEVSETCAPLEKINAWLSPNRLVSLIGPTYEDDAGNGMDANLYGGGFKHFDIDGFIAVVKAQNWKSRSKVQLWVKGVEEGMGTEPFTLFKLGESRSAVAVKPAVNHKRRAARAKAVKSKKRSADRRKATATRKAK